MRYFTLTILALLLSFSAAIAQSGDVVLFTSGGQQFYAVLNGIKQNAAPQTNLRISDLNAPNYKLTVIFDDQSLQPMQSKNLYVKPGMLVTYEVKKNKKGAWVLRYLSEHPLATAPQAAGTTTVVYTTTEPVATTTYTEPASTTTVTETTTTNTSVGTNDGMGGSVTMDMNVNDGMGGENVSMDINLNVSDPTMTGGTTSTTTTTTTTSSSTYSTGGTYTDNTTTHHTPETGGYTAGYSGEIGCPIAMDDGNFESAKASVASKTFSDSKMTVAKQVAQANCLTANQVKELVALFDFEDDRLEYAKYAYQFTYDRGNYYMINDAFEFETTIMELDRYIEDYNNR